MFFFCTAHRTPRHTRIVQDFELTPGLVSRESAHKIYVQLVYPREMTIAPKALAAREGGHGSRGGDAGAEAAGLGLRLGQWLAWLGLAAVGCTWFDKQRVSVECLLCTVCACVCFLFSFCVCLLL